MPVGPTLVCDAKVDVVILLDGSGSLGQKGWAATKVMGQKLLNAFDTPNIQAQVAVQLFSGPSTWYNWFVCTGRYWWRKPDVTRDCGITWVTTLTADTAHFTTDFKKAAGLIKALSFPSRATFTSLALGQAQGELKYGREGVDKVVVVVTDGVPTNPYKTGQAAESIKNVARLIWVPVTAGAPKEQLNEWASTPVEQNVVRVKDFKEMQTPEVVTKIVAEVCSEAH